MNYGELKAQFEGLLKRRDMTAAQSDTFLQQAVSRVQRLLRLPPMEKSIAVTYDGETFTDGQIPIPSDYLRLIAMTATDGNGETEVKHTDLQAVLDLSEQSGLPLRFVRRGGYWVFGPVPEVGTVIRVDYLSEFTPFATDADTSYLTQGASDLIIYGALSFAADWFVDKRAPLFEARFKAVADEIQNQADQDELINAVASPAYYFPED